MLPFFAWKIFSISFFISLDFYLQVLLKSAIKRLNMCLALPLYTLSHPIFVLVECQTAFKLLNCIRPDYLLSVFSYSAFKDSYPLKINCTFVIWCFAKNTLISSNKSRGIIVPKFPLVCLRLSLLRSS